VSDAKHSANNCCFPSAKCETLGESPMSSILGHQMVLSDWPHYSQSDRIRLAPLPPPLSFLSYHQCPSSLSWSSFSPNNTTGLSPPAVRHTPPSGGATGALDSCSADGRHQWCGRHPALRKQKLAFPPTVPSGRNSEA
jgi:hypothetical protein